MNRLPDTVHYQHKENNVLRGILIYSEMCINNLYIELNVNERIYKENLTNFTKVNFKKNEKNCAAFSVLFSVQTVSHKII